MTKLRARCINTSHKKNLSVTKLWSIGANLQFIFFWLSSMPMVELHDRGRGGSIMPRGNNMHRGSNMPGGQHQTRGSSMPKRAAFPGQAACPDKEQQAKGSSMPRASSMPRGGAACPGKEQHAPRRSSWEGSIARGSSMLREALC